MAIKGDKNFSLGIYFCFNPCTLTTRCSLSSQQYYLHMDGRGNYDFKPITEETVEFGS